MMVMKKKSTTESKKKRQILKDLEQSVKWVKLLGDGKVQAKTIDQLLSEL
jgi:ribosomal protein L15